MSGSRAEPETPSVLQATIGYLNFSSGAADGGFRRNLNRLFAEAESRPGPQPAWQALRDRLLEHTVLLQSASPAFRQVEQAQSVLRLVFDHLLPAFRQRHRDLLQHQSDEQLFRPFLLARAFETTLAQDPPWDEVERIVSGSLDQLNDFTGYRPLAVLNNERRMTPYAHEWVAVVPWYFRDAGVAVGRYQEIIATAIDILTSVDSAIMSESAFSLENLEELSVDPRAYDFDHPINKRPNYHFGQWDPGRIDNRGNYSRFVLQEATLDALLARVDEGPVERRQDLLWEAAAVLAGTMLMASAVCGGGPEWYNSSTSLSALVPRIASFRDRYYQRLLATTPGVLGDRLRVEATELRQPFGAARQELNQRLARLRASQLQHVHLAQLFALMGQGEASLRQARIVPVTSARMLCEISSRVTEAHLALDRGLVDAAGALVPEIVDLLHRAIECGAIVDPWNILGFQGQFSLFPALENSVRDHRVDVLLHMMGKILGLFVRLAGEAAGAGAAEVQADVMRQLRDTARWWDRFASVEVDSVDGVSAAEAVGSAEAVSAALSAWHGAGAGAGDIAFWRGHVDRFQSPKAYHIVISALLDKRDFVAAMALLFQWLERSDEVALSEGPYSFHDLTLRWLVDLYDERGRERGTDTAPWPQVAKFVAHLEANAEGLWRPPGELFDPSDRVGRSEDDDDAEFDDDVDFDADDLDDDEEDESSPFDDEFDDDDEGGLAEGEYGVNEFELEAAHQRLEPRLEFLRTVARFFSVAASHPLEASDANADRRDTLLGWLAQAQAVRAGLLRLLTEVHEFRIPTPTGAHDSMVEYDRRRRIKDALAGHVAAACVDAASAARVIMAALGEAAFEGGAPWERRAVRLLGSVLKQDAAAAASEFDPLRELLLEQAILYVPLSKGGDPQTLVEAQSLKSLVADLLAGLPRLGLLAETCWLISAIEKMEHRQPRGEGAVTEFNRLFKIGYQSLVEAIVESARGWEAEATAHGSRHAPYNQDLVECLQTLTEPLLRRWLEHSKTVRLSSLEKLADERRWNEVVEFIKAYGADVFTPQFMNLGNLRSLLHQGAEGYLQSLEEEVDPLHPVKLVEDLDRAISRSDAARLLAVIAEAIVENFGEFKDYNTTTTQSDRGEQLYMLLDFLRLKASYERFAWNIRPIAMAHETLVRCERPAAAELWRRAAAERTAEVADWHLKRLGELESRYRLRLPTISDRLAERFMQPMVIDRLRALVRPAMADARGGGESPSFAQLEREIAELSERPTGSGLDVPAWLVALEQEAAATSRLLGHVDQDESPPSLPRLGWRLLSLDEVQRQLDNLDV